MQRISATLISIFSGDKFAYVLQDVVLFDDTVASNVMYGSMDEKNVGLLEVLHACKAAGIHKEIMALH